MTFTGWWQRWLETREWDRTAALFALITILLTVAALIHQVWMDRRRARQETEATAMTDRILKAIERSREIQEVQLHEADAAAELTNEEVQALRMIENGTAPLPSAISREDPRNSWYILATDRLRGKGMVAEGGGIMTVRGYEMLRLTRVRQFIEKVVVVHSSVAR